MGRKCVSAGSSASTYFGGVRGEDVAGAVVEVRAPAAELHYLPPARLPNGLGLSLRFLLEQQMVGDSNVLAQGGKIDGPATI